MRSHSAATITPVKVPKPQGDLLEAVKINSPIGYPRLDARKWGCRNTRLSFAPAVAVPTRPS